MYGIAHKGWHGWKAPLAPGAAHRVHTAVAIQFEDRLEMANNESVVHFAGLSGRQIDTYVASGEPMGKPGAYAIQGKAAAFISALRGSYSGVAGLPLYEAANLIARFSGDALS